MLHMFCFLRVIGLSLYSYHVTDDGSRIVRCAVAMDTTVVWLVCERMICRGVIQDRSSVCLHWGFVRNSKTFRRRQRSRAQNM